MEEWTSPTGNRHNNFNKLSTATSLRLALPSDRSSDTYIVQVPRDQVYRVPPPENAKIVESYRKPNYQSSRKFGCCCWILLGLVIFGIIIGVTIWIIHMLYIPKCPNFSVVSINLKNVSEPSRGHGQKNQPQQHSIFDIDMKVNNINERMDVSFGEGKEGKTTLVFKKHDIGQGKYPSISQNAKDSRNVHLNLDVSSNGKLPGDFLKSVEDNKKPIIMSLVIHVPIEIKSWVKNLKKDLTITCDFDVEGLTKKSKILPNQCTTDF